MRNLQKILALALALIMSFSLVVTANAFTDDEQITETYAESVNVLAQLGVFKGYTDDTYRPQDSISRAEVAAIIYRIATGDVTDSQTAIYSDWNRFTDVREGEWWAGYINYCANAEYIKGYGNGKFGPDDDVTGYEALAMILRALGYGKMGEFVGSDWAVNTAARANGLKITKNVTSAATLGAPATRELVAELLFRSILQKTVTYNTVTGYVEDDTTLGKQTLNLDEIEGVVVANEYADLYSTQVLDEGKTQLEVAKDDVRNLDIASEITDIGESRYAYVVGSKVLALADTGDNVIKETGDSTTINTDKKFKDFSGLTKNGDTEFYLNFGREGKFSCDQRLEFQVVFYTKEAYDTFIEKYEDIGAYAFTGNSTSSKDDDWSLANGYWTADANGDITVRTINTVAESDKAYTFPAAPAGKTGAWVLFNRVIPAGDEITAEEMNILEGIFAAADEIAFNGQDKDKLTGDVYLGTKSSENRDKEERDVSNSISFRKFRDEYINSEIWDQDIENSGNGEWLKIVDNDGDGNAEYAFLTEYHLDEATGTYTKSGTEYIEFETLDVEDYEDNDGVVVYVDEIAVGDVVLYTNIDNKIVMTKVEPVVATINTVNFKDNSCTTTTGETYVESDIFNDTKMDELVSNMEDKVEYNLYLDKYGYVRAYELTQDNIYGLVTELYYTRGQNLQYVTNAEMTVEMKKGDKAADEYTVSNKSGNDFLLQLDTDNTAETWLDLEDYHQNLTTKPADWVTDVYSVGTSAKRGEIVLQPAKSHLAVRSNVNTGANGYEGRSYNNIFTNATTNVAKYVETGDTEVRINSAAKLATDSKGNQWYYTDATHRNGKTTTTGTAADEGDVLHPVYAVDYIEIANNVNIAEDARQFTIASGDYNDSSRYIQAVDTTEFYVVDTQAKKFSYFVGYKNVFAIGADKITAAYAVARNTNSDSNANDYWVADVVVIEVTEIARTYDSIALPYYNPEQTSDRSSMAREAQATDRVRLLNTLNSESVNPMIDMIPVDRSWGNQLTDWRFYNVDESAVEDGVLVADAIEEIRWDGVRYFDDYSEYGIYAGVITRGADLINYVEVNLNGETDYYETKRVPVTNSDGVIFAIHSSKGDNSASCTAESINMRPNSDRTDLLTEGDQVIYVINKDGDLAFMVNVSYVNAAGTRWAPDWLTALYTEVVNQQKAEANAVTFDQALKAYNEWVADPSKKAVAVEKVQAALANKAITGNDRDRLNEMWANLNDGVVPGTEKGQLTITSSARDMGIDILSIDKAGKAGTAADPYIVSMVIANPKTTVIEDLYKALTSTISEKLEIVAKTSGGTVLSSETPVSNAAEVIVTLSTSGIVYKFVPEDAVTDPGHGYGYLTLEGGAKAYRDAACTDEIVSDSLIATGTRVYLKANGTGKFYVKVDNAAASVVGTSSGGATTHDFLTSGFATRVTFFESVDGYIKTLNLNPEMIEKYGAVSSGIKADTDNLTGYAYYIDITVDTKSVVPTSTSGDNLSLLATWFGISLNSEGLGSGNGYEGTGALGAYYEPAAAGGKFVVTARGEAGGDNFAVAVYVEYKAPTTLKYETKFTGTSKSAVKLALTQVNGDPDNATTSPVASVKFFNQDGEELQGLTISGEGTMTSGTVEITITDDLGDNVTKISAEITLNDGTVIKVPATSVLG